MKAIIIEDKDAKDLVHRLALEKYNDSHTHPRQEPDKSVTKEEMHRWFHYVVVGWLQEQGASV